MWSSRPLTKSEVSFTVFKLILWDISVNLCPHISNPIYYKWCSGTDLNSLLLLQIHYSLPSLTAIKYPIQHLGIGLSLNTLLVLLSGLILEVLHKTQHSFVLDKGQFVNMLLCRLC